MRHPRLVLLGVVLVSGLLRAAVAGASGYGLFQHGGRGIGEAGAFTARGSEPSALTYNPAAITELPGFQVQVGLDFNNAKNEYFSPDSHFQARHIIDFPPNLYLTWKAKESPLALGLGVDAPYWYKVDWLPALFPGRLLKRRFELEVYEVHPVVAWDLGEGWSLGGGLRYVYGSEKQGDNKFITVPVGGSTTSVEIIRDLDGTVDALAWDAAVHYGDPSWGWGAVYRSAAKLSGTGDMTYHPRDVVVPGLADQLLQQLDSGRGRQSFEIPTEVRTGAWVAPYPELRIELDVSWQSWSSLHDTTVVYSPDRLGDGPTVVTPRRFNDTYDVRLGIEGNLTDALMLFGGIAREQSPISKSTLLPDFPRGDAMVYAAGFSYSFQHISFDAAYSFHDHDSVTAHHQEPLQPNVVGTYQARDKVWGFSVRRRF